MKTCPASICRRARNAVSRWPVCWPTRPQLWILDEPFTALDVAAVQLLQDVIRRHVENGGMAIITTHQEVAMIGEHTRTIVLGGRRMLEPLIWIIRRDLTIAMRRRSDVFTTLIFFVIVVSLFPLGIGPEPNTLRLIAPGIVWVGALLASMLALEQIFSADHRDGTLEQMLLTPQPVALLVAGKVLAHWLVSGVPLVLMAPLLGPAVRPVLGCAADADRLAAAGHPGAEPDRRHRCRADPGAAFRWRVARPAGTAAVHPGADLRCRRRRGHRIRARRDRRIYRCWRPSWSPAWCWRRWQRPRRCGWPKTDEMRRPDGSDRRLCAGLVSPVGSTPPPRGRCRRRWNRRVIRARSRKSAEFPAKWTAVEFGACGGLTSRPGDTTDRH